MKKTYTLTTDWAKDAGEHIPVIWHNDPNSSFTIDCEESIEELKEHVLNEVKKNADTSKAIVFRGFTEETIFDTNVNMYVDREVELELTAIARCEKCKQKFGTWVRVRAFEDWQSWLKRCQQV